MTVENALLVGAWAVLLVIGLAVAPRFLPRRERAEPSLREPTFYDVGGPILDLAPDLALDR